MRSECWQTTMLTPAHLADHGFRKDHWTFCGRETLPRLIESARLNHDKRRAAAPFCRPHKPRWT